MYNLELTYSVLTEKLRSAVLETMLYGLQSKGESTQSLVFHSKYIKPAFWNISEFNYANWCL